MTTIIKGRNCPTLEMIPIYDDSTEGYFTGEVSKPKLVDVIYKLDGVEVSEGEFRQAKQAAEAQSEKA